MTLTTAQAAGILAMLEKKVDPDTLRTIERILSLHTETPDIPDGDSYTSIRQYSQNLYDVLLKSGRGIATDHPDDELLMVYMDRDKVKRLFRSVPSGGYLAALPGIHRDKDGAMQLTVSLLATDGNKMPLPGHISGSMHGEQSWDARNIMRNMAAALPTDDHLV